MQLAEHRLPGLLVSEHEFELPLDHASPAARRSRCSRARSPRPTGATGRSSSSSRAARARGAAADAAARARRAGSTARCEEFRVLMLDQRGTGRSTPVGTLPG